MRSFVITSVVVLLMTGIFGSLNATFFNSAANFSDAGAKIAVWKGPLTFKGIIRLIPCSCSKATA